MAMVEPRHSGELEREEGSAIVELILALPLLLLVLAAIAESGLIFFQYNQLTDRVRDAARYAAYHADFAQANPLTATVLTGATNMLQCGTVAGCANTPYSNVSIGALSPEPISDGYHVRVDATFQHPILFSWYMTACGDPCQLALTATAIMRAK